MRALQLAAITPEQYRNWFEQQHTLLQHRSPFHHPAWLRAVSSGLGFTSACIGIYQQRELVAALPGFLTRRGPFRLFGSPLPGTMTSYLGPVGLMGAFDGVALAELVQQCSRFARQQWRVTYTEFALREPLERLERLGPGWEQRRPGSYCLDLRRGEHALWMA